MPEGRRPVVEGYETVSHVGSGGSADVWLVRDQDGGLLAAKVFRSVDLSAGRREWRSLRRHRGPHIVTALDYLRDDEGRSVLLMPYLAGGSLWDVVVGRHGLTCGELVTALAPIAAALTRVHSSGCVHGDVTPRNVLFDRAGKPWLTDLGAIRPTAQPGAAEWGSAGFVPPELLDGLPPTPASDVYSLGAVAWFALTAEPPQLPALRPDLHEIVPAVPPDLVELIEACLATAPATRPDSAQVAPRLLAVEPPVPVPLDALRPAPGDAGDAATGITRRLRDEAQKRQRATPTDRPASRQRSAAVYRHKRVPLYAGAAALAALAATVAWGAFGETAPKSGPVASHTPQAAPSTIETVSYRGQAPTQDMLQDLLDCRARAWNAGKLTALADCYVPASQAMKDDSAALQRAAASGVKYAGVSYTLSSVGRAIREGPHTWAVDLDITRHGYEVTSVGRAVRMPPQTDAVTLVLTGHDDGYRISGWRVR